MLKKSKINAMKRIREEYISINKSQIYKYGILVGVTDEDNYFHWRITLIGPKDTSYRDGVFILYINFPDGYPNSCPEVFFRTPIYHVNVIPIKSNMRWAQPLGHVCISILNWWKPENKMTDVLLNIFSLFYLANPDGRHGFERGYEFRTNKALHEEKIKYFTKKYADPKFANIDKEYFESWDFTYNE